MHVTPLAHVAHNAHVRAVSRRDLVTSWSHRPRSGAARRGRAPVHELADNSLEDISRAALAQFTARG